MEKNEIMRSLENIKEQLEASNHTVFALFLQGSQNYGLDIHNKDYQSDIDCKAFVMPTFEDLYLSRQTNKILTTEYGLVEVKDVRLMFELMKKANPSYIELLFTEYFISDSSGYKEFAEDLVKDRKPLLLRGIYGMILEKVRMLKSSSPSVINQIEKYGYDPKQIHHIIRLYYLAEGLDQENYESYNVLLKPTGKKREFLLDLKLGIYSLAEVETMASEYLQKTKEIVDRTPIEGFIKNDALNKIGSFIMECVKKHFKENIN